MGPKKYLVTIENGEEKKVFVSEEGTRLMLSNRSFVVIGVTPFDQLPRNMRVELLTRDNKHKLKLTKKLKK